MSCLIGQNLLLTLTVLVHRSRGETALLPSPRLANALIPAIENTWNLVLGQTGSPHLDTH
jgi:hypothetical protein